MILKKGVPMAAQLKHKFNDEKVTSIHKAEPKFQEYKALNTQATRFQDLLFFGRIVSFAISAVLSCFVLLTANVTPILAFPIGMLMGSLLTVLVFFLIDLLRR
ncbi:DUF3270 family protein [Streptococcus porci]|uniref:DUF3270 family protein n=1 Tax=Streptococcus porci TaxID=502567 RepID=UPI00048852CB|nr:DUF3270 family protein [Streptococcus porci]